MGWGSIALKVYPGLPSTNEKSGLIVLNTSHYTLGDQREFMSHFIEILFIISTGMLPVIQQ